jgi:serine O-acetyltransferase
MLKPQIIKAPLEHADPVWARIRSEAEVVVRQEPHLASFIHAAVLEHDALASAVVQRISDRLDHAVMTGTTIRLAFLDALQDAPDLADAFRADIVATYDRDPATTRFIEPLLYFKGFHAIQTHRLAHWLWRKHRRDFALYLQSRSSTVFQTDIHPAVRIDRGRARDISARPGTLPLKVNVNIVVPKWRVAGGVRGDMAGKHRNRI